MMMYGFLNINKPKGKTSYDVIREIKRITKIRKIGHTGTLDPIAQGVLVIAINQATKMIEFINNDDKKYIAKIILGKSSDTYDAQGEINNVSSKKPENDEVITTIKKFIGEINQTPPKFSAIKVEGKRAYDLARRGEEFELKSRKTQIYSIKIVSYNYPVLEIEVDCASGTYIRSLADDIGKELLTGAYIDELLRTRAGEFLLEDSIEVSDILKNGIENCIIPIEKLSYNMPIVFVDDNELQKLDYGQIIEKENVKVSEERGYDTQNSHLFAAYFDNKLVGVLEKINEKPKLLLKYKKKLNVI